MRKANESEVQCPNCGSPQSIPAENCVACGSKLFPPSAQTAKQSDHSTLLKSQKMQWVAAVIAFWISVGVLGAVVILQDRLSLVLVSICLGLMILGIGLKIRYQWHLRKYNGNP